MALIATKLLRSEHAGDYGHRGQYMQMWAQHAAAMFGYAGASQTASTLTPFTSPLPSTSPAGVRCRRPDYR
jgi:PPE-repeat protein